MISNPLAIISIVLGVILLVPMICRKLRIPSIVGFILMGILFGQYGLGIFGQSATIATLGKLGMLYIMLQAGIEIDMNDFRQYRRNAVIFGLYSFIFPFALGLLTSRLLGFNWATSSLLGAMYGSHTLMTYPIVSRYGVQKNAAANIAVGGTMLTITLALLVLASIKSNFMLEANIGTLDIIFRIILTFCVIGIVFPWLAQRFFKRWTDPTSGFLVVMTMMVISAYLADFAGLEGILGAFVCGVALNRLVPNLSPVMNRINFVGNNLFVPLFLLSVGMMIDVHVIWDGWTTIIIALVMIATKLLGKWLAAWISQISFGLQSLERQLIFGLTHATAAGTLAIVTIGYQAGFFSSEILNAAILMILILCTFASFVTEHAAKELSLQEEARLESDKEDDSWLVMSVNQDQRTQLEDLAQLSELHAPEFAHEADWTEAQNVVQETSKATIIYHSVQPLNTVSRLLVAIPKHAEKEHDFISCFGLVRRLSSQVGAKVVFFANTDTQNALKAFCRRKGKYLRASYREMSDWEDVLMIAKQMKADDLIVLVNARPSTPSYNPLFERVPKMLDKFFNEHNYILVYPEQGANRGAADILHSDQTPASMTWSIVSKTKQWILNILKKIQMR